MSPGNKGEKEQLMADIRHPIRAISPDKKKKVEKSFKFTHKFFISIGLVCLTLILLGFFIFDIKGSATRAYRGFNRLSDQVKSLSLFDFGNTLTDIEKELNALDRQARFLSLAPKLKEIPSIIRDLKLIIDTSKNLIRDLSIVSGDGIALAFDGRGEELIDSLKRLKENLIYLGELSDSIQRKAAEFGVEKEGLDFIDDSLIETSSNLSILIDFLDQDRPLHLVILFENHSELRPSGGFAGSYGELILEKGSVKALNVDDIYHPDHFLKLNIIPPLQLQTVTPNFGARDTGWFFDFRTSAAKLMDYLAASDLYQDTGTEFDGVIALNVSVVEEILKIVGPIDVPEYKLKLDHNNFLSEIQKEVEENKVPGENPKKVLQFAAPRLIQSLGRVGEDKKGKLLEVFINKAHSKDIKFFFRDDDMEKLVLDLGSGGDVYELEEDFYGDYLALVNTNVAGGKTDILMDQRVVLRSEVGINGVIQNNLTVTKKHGGKLYIEPWYNHLNQTFFKIFTVPEAQLTYIEGGKKKEIIPKLNYSTSGYQVDSDLKRIESTRILLDTPSDGYAESYMESGKKVFATWFNVESGESKVLQVHYQAGSMSLVDGRRYVFVLDKQSGSKMSFEYLLAAPDGYYWQESGSDLYKYRETALPTRVEIPLTLRKR